MYFASIMYMYILVSEASDVTGINLSQERTEEEIQRDIKHQEDEEENCKWTQAPTLLLISEYKNRQERIDTGRLKKKRAFEEIAEVLKQNMYPFTDVQCASRMKTLIRQYKTVKDNNNTSGSKRKSFLYENELDSLFKDRPNIRPQFVMSSGTISGAADDASDDSSDEIVPKTQKRKMENCEDEKGSKSKIRKTQVSEVLEFMKTNASEQEKRREEREERKEKRHEDKMNMFKELIKAFKNQ